MLRYVHQAFETSNEVLSNPSIPVPPYLDFPLSFVNGWVPCAIKDILGQNRLMIEIIIACFPTTLESWTPLGPMPPFTTVVHPPKYWIFYGHMFSQIDSLPCGPCFLDFIILFKQEQRGMVGWHVILLSPPPPPHLLLYVDSNNQWAPHPQEMIQQVKVRGWKLLDL